jgi:O-antigen/teichoic acid export membrane protein
MRRDVAVLFVSRAVASVAQALAVLLLARWSDPHLFGEVSSLLGLGALVVAVLDFGLGDYLLRIRAGDTMQRLLEPAYFLNYAGSWAVFLLVAVLGLALLPTSPLAAVLLALWVAGDKYVDTGLALPIADGKVLAVGVVLVIRRALAVAAFLAIVTSGTDALLAFALAQTVGLLVGLAFVQARVAPPRTREGANRIPELFKEGLWFWAATLSSQAQTLDVPVVAGISGADAAGVYSVGGRLTRPFILFSTALSLVLVPAATRAKPGFTRFVTVRIIGVAVGLALVGVALIPLMPAIVDLTVGSRYASGAASAAALVIVMPFVGLQGRGSSRFVAVNGIVFGVATVAGLAVGAALGGAFGAALGLGVIAVAKFVTLSMKSWALG